MEPPSSVPQRVKLNINTLEHDVDILQKRINRAKAIAFITGAGTSTAFGIPDYKSGGRILYTKAALQTSETARNSMWKKYSELYAMANIAREQPQTQLNAYIAQLEHNGLLSMVCTQNVDGLHTLAVKEKSKLIELHGTIYTSTCQSCNRSYDTGAIINNDYKCLDATCKDPSVVLPDIICFDDFINESYLLAVREAVFNSDIVFVVGTAAEIDYISTLVEEMLIDKHNIGTQHYERVVAIVNLYPIHQMLELHQRNLRKEYEELKKKHPYALNMSTSRPSPYEIRLKRVWYRNDTIENVFANLVTQRIEHVSSSKVRQYAGNKLNYSYENYFTELSDTVLDADDLQKMDEFANSEPIERTKETKRALKNIEMETMGNVSEAIVDTLIKAIIDAGTIGDSTLHERDYNLIVKLKLDIRDLSKISEICLLKLEEVPPLSSAYDNLNNVKNKVISYGRSLMSMEIDPILEKNRNIQNNIEKALKKINAHKQSIQRLKTGTLQTDSIKNKIDKHKKDIKVLNKKIDHLNDKMESR